MLDKKVKRCLILNEFSAAVTRKIVYKMIIYVTRIRHYQIAESCIEMY